MRIRHVASRGFTLIELMVVIVILGLLAGLVVPNVQRSLRKAKIQTAKTTMIRIEGAIDQFRVEKNRLPDSLEELVGEDGILGSELPKDPWGGDYQYVKIDRKKFDIICLGADGQEGGEDDEDRDIHREDMRKADDDGANASGK
jgi:general secretion pathway protein G